MQMRVQPASPSQHASLVDLLRELHGYYNEGSTVAPEVVSAYLVEHLLAADSGLCLVVACDEAQKVLGFAAVALTYSLVDFAPERRRHCWLKELYVRDAHRSMGVGEALMAWVARYAVDHGCGRIDWPVKASNSRGIAFYERLGAQRVEDRLSYRLGEPNLGALARSRAGGL